VDKDHAIRPIIADDEPDILRLVSLTLERHGYHVIEASNGEEAVMMIQEHRPDVVVLDVMMPGMTGPEVGAAMATETRLASIPVLLLSAKGEDRDISMGLEAGAAAYLTRPFFTRHLVETRAELLEDR